MGSIGSRSVKEGPARRAHDSSAAKFYFIVRVNRGAVGKAELTLKIV
jgi:hypothetical protein